MANFSLTDYESNSASQTNTSPTTNNNYVSYFSLKSDGDEAVVRFIYSSPDQLELTSTHEVTINGKKRKVMCLRTPQEEINKCPLCAAGNRPQTKFFCKMVEYVRDENGQIVIVPRLWERSISFAKTLKSYFDEYGALSEMVFKIKRHGVAGSTSTTYDLLPANRSVYNETAYPKDFSAFDNYKISSYAVLDKNYDEMVTYLNTGVMPMPEKPQQKPTSNAVSTNQTWRPTSTMNNVQVSNTQTNMMQESAVRPKRTYTY